MPREHTGHSKHPLPTTQEKTTHGHHQIVNTKIRLIIFFVAKDEEAEVEWFYEDLQDLLELTPQKDVLFIMGDWNAKIGSQEIPGIACKFGLGVQNKQVKG